MKELIIYLIFIIGAVAIWNVETIAAQLQSKATEWSEDPSAISVAGTTEDFQSYPAEEEFYLDALPVVQVSMYREWEKDWKQYIYKAEFVYVEKHTSSTLRFYSEVSLEEMIEDINYHFNINQPILGGE